MKTFDLALGFLEELEVTPEGFDTMMVSENTSNEVVDKEKDIKYKIHTILVDYLKHLVLINQASNKYYHTIVFNAAMFHTLFKKTGKPSYFDEAVKIVETYKTTINPEIFSGTIYPKKMIESFIEYCDKQDPGYTFLSSKSDVRIELFCVAYHYIIDHNS